MANKKSRNRKITPASNWRQKQLASVLKTKFKIWGLSRSVNQIMKIRSFLEPHAARTFRTIVFLILLIIFSSRIFSFLLPLSSFEKAKRTLLTDPNNISARLTLVDEFLKNNQLEEAKKELSSVESIKTSSFVLGTSSWLDELVGKYKESSPEEISKLIEVWEKVVINNPGYRDGYIKLSVYYYKLGDLVRAKDRLGKAKQIDPNFESIGQLENLME